MDTAIDVTLKDLVLVGGGHAHVYIIKMFAMHPIAGVRLTMISKSFESPYSGMMPGFLAGYYAHSDCHIDLQPLCALAGARVIWAEAVGINTITKTVQLKDKRPPIPYDILSIDIGIVPRPIPNRGSPYPNITPVKPIEGLGRRWDQIMNRIIKFTTIVQSLKLVVVGGGAGGVELCLAIRYRLSKELLAICRDPHLVRVTIVTRGSTLLPTHNRYVQDVITRIMSERDIDIIYGANIVDVETSDDRHTSSLVSHGGRRIEFDEVVWCTEAIAQAWVKTTTLQTTEEGFICVQNTLESTNTDDVFACGDAAHLTASPRPKAGVFAVRAGPPLYMNLRRRLLGQSLDSWTPQTEFLGIIGTYANLIDSAQSSSHTLSAVASKGPIAVEGDYVWKLKDRIDRQWIAMYKVASTSGVGMPMISSLKYTDGSSIADIMGETTRDVLAQAKMRCGGCGSKVGSQVLSRALSRVRELGLHMTPEALELVGVTATSGGIHTALGDDAAVVRVPDQQSALLVHTVDFFRAPIFDAFLFGRIAAQHALSDVFAMNARPLTALAICLVPFGLEKKTEDTLVQMLAGCITELTKVGCALVGGHSAESQGPKPELGLTVTGCVSSDSDILRKGPLTAGHVLILTKPLGTGVILAADMKACASGASVDAAINSMLQSNQSAARVLHGSGCCEACTDVTGFGFLGHLLEMAQFRDNNSYGETASESLKVAIYLDSIPELTGATDYVKAGILSSLHNQNTRAARAIRNPDKGLEYPETYNLLFDPQTSGGLLASVSFDKAEQVLQSLREAGYDRANIVGAVEKEEDRLCPSSHADNYERKDAMAIAKGGPQIVLSISCSPSDVKSGC